ncbi:ABC transporter permease [Phytoactinopolyspora endophytica]|uniref:ABC transporter permease n=1 Tax=Phytoactinopolyspora endophytica TaxID=1642495 RepID=UPI00101E09A8|nr:ABC transporter permease [Phytoactinopolyspora endophytica]
MRRAPLRRRLALRDLLGEALAGVAARPSRLALTTLGTVVGIAALVATMGLGQTASGQISGRFDATSAVRVVVEAGEREGTDGGVKITELPWDAADRVSRLAGVAAAGTFAQVAVEGAQVRGVPVSDPGGAVEHDVPVAAGSPGLFDAVNAVLSDGRFFDAGHDGRGDPVVVLGRYAAERLGVNRVDSQPSIFIGDRPFTVIGIIDSASHRSELLDAVVLPMGTADSLYGLDAPGALEIRTELGAAQLIGSQAALAVAPNDPELLNVDVPPAPGSLRDEVSTDVNVLFLALGGLALLVGGLGIANITLLSVMERISEIGLRRAVGATRRHIANQFVVESIVIGFLGGLIGAAAGVLATVGVSMARGWTPLLDPGLAAVAPFLGALIGLVAGTYPAWRASTIEPIAALRGG